MSINRSIVIGIWPALNRYRPWQALSSVSALPWALRCKLPSNWFRRRADFWWWLLPPKLRSMRFKSGGVFFKMMLPWKCGLPDPNRNQDVMSWGSGLCGDGTLRDSIKSANSPVRNFRDDGISENGWTSWCYFGRNIYENIRYHESLYIV